MEAIYAHAGHLRATAETAPNPVVPAVTEETCVSSCILDIPYYLLRVTREHRLDVNVLP